MKLRNGLEYEIACSSTREEVLHRHSVVDDDGDGNILFFYHTGFTDSKLEQSPGYRLLEHRVNNVASLIKDSPYYSQGNYEQSLIDAFHRLDEELEELVKEIGWDRIPLSAEYLWRTRYNTLVVLLRRKKELYVAGASHLHVSVIRGQDIINLTSGNHINQSIILRRSQYGGPDPMKSAGVNEFPRYLWMEGVSVKEHPQLFYYNRGTLKGTEEYLVAACDNLDDDIRPLLNGGMPVFLPRFYQERGLKFAVNYIHNWAEDDTEAFMFALKLNSRKREHEDSSDACSSDVSSEDSKSA